MGRGVIVSHLGDAHYRIGLDIDVSYARNQLVAIQTYLDEFAPKYAEATEAKDAAKAALTPINDRLTDYLAAGQAASQAAYDAMVAAYEAFADAVQNLPDQEMVQAAQDDADEVSGEFAANPNEETALDTLAADSLWQSLVGDFLDVAAVQAATDAKNAAISDLVTAQQEFDLGNIPEEALTWYQQNYATLRGDWLTVVSENSGPARVSTLEGQWQAATEAFDTARKDLGKLLGSGGLPEELAAILKDQEKAYADYHAALQNWQSMTLVKAEKEKLQAELQSRLLPYTDNDGEPIRQEVNAWCCDYSEDLSPGAEVATIEIPGERDLAVRVRPGYESRETYAAERDGILQPSWASSPEATYWNWALHPGNARWHPNYRLGEILLIDAQAGTCTVQLDQQTHSPRSKTRDGAVLDVNNPIKYQIDPDSGEQTAILPGDNVQVDGGITTLTDVEIEYMECNADAFETGDHVMVEFQGRDWTAPKVIGFAESPRPCSVDAVILSATPNGGALETLRLPANIPPVPPATQSATLPNLSHSQAKAGGNIDWRSADGKTRLTWDGPPGRSVVFQPWIGPANQFDIALQYSGISPQAAPEWQWHGFWIDPPEWDSVSQPAAYTFCRRFGRSIWKNGSLLAQVPFGSVVLGTAQITQTEGQASINYLVAVTTPGIPPIPDIPIDDAIDAAEITVFAVAVSAIVDPENVDWSPIGYLDLSPYGRVLPIQKIAAFSTDGSRFAVLAPRMRDPDEFYPRSSFDYPDNDLIIRGNIENLTAAFVITEQAKPAVENLFDNYELPGLGPVIANYMLTSQFGDNIITAIDYAGNTERVLTATARERVKYPTIPLDTFTAESVCIYKVDGQEIGRWSGHANTTPGRVHYIEHDAVYPLFVDLRYRAWLWLKTESREEQTFYQNVPPSQSWKEQHIDMTTRIVDQNGTVRYESRYVRGSTLGGYRIDWNEASNPGGDFTETGLPCRNATSQMANTRGFGLAKASSIQPMLYNDVPVFPWFNVHAQTSGNIVCNTDFYTSQQNKWLGAEFNGLLIDTGYDYLPPFFYGDYGEPQMLIRAAFATQYDLDRVWLNHLLSTHNPDELPEEGWDGSLTAIQDNLKPLYKV